MGRKVRMNTRKHLHRYKAKLATECDEEARARQALHRVPRRWHAHTLEMHKMLKGCEVDE